MPRGGQSCAERRKKPREQGIGRRRRRRRMRQTRATRQRRKRQEGERREVGRPRGGMKVAARIGERLRREIGRGGRPRVGDGSAHHTPLLNIPVWWRRAVLPSLPWVVRFLCFFFGRRTDNRQTGPPPPARAGFWKDDQGHRWGSPAPDKGHDRLAARCTVDSQPSTVVPEFGLYTLFFIFYILFRSDFQPEYTGIFENIGPIWSHILAIFENIDPICYFLDKNTERIRKKNIDRTRREKRIKANLRVVMLEVG